MSGIMQLPDHSETAAVVAASPAEVFDFLDDPHQLTGHMSRRSAMMLGSRMKIETDQQSGQAVGSVIRMAGRMFGVRLSLEEKVTERDPPRRKIWETIGTPRLVVLSNYQMGFEIAAQDVGSRIRVFINYRRPDRGFARVLGWLFAAPYARWCTRRMVRDAARHFRGSTGRH